MAVYNQKPTQHNSPEYPNLKLLSSLYSLKHCVTSSLIGSNTLLFTLISDLYLLFHQCERPRSHDCKSKFQISASSLFLHCQSSFISFLFRIFHKLILLLHFGLLIFLSSVILSNLFSKVVKQQQHFLFCVGTNT
jgi:hypothetical protein